MYRAYPEGKINKVLKGISLRKSVLQVCVLWRIVSVRSYLNVGKL